jgi:hypothetical protein
MEVLPPVALARLSGCCAGPPKPGALPCASVCPPGWLQAALSLLRTILCCFLGVFIWIAAAPDLVAGCTSTADDRPVLFFKSACGPHSKDEEIPCAALACAGWEAATAAARRMRLAAYAANRADVVRCLLAQLATLPEAIEVGRVTGLTLGQVRAAVPRPD